MCEVWEIDAERHAMAHLQLHVYFVVTQDTSDVAKHPYTTLQVIYHITMITLFTKFYIETYCTKPAEKKPTPKKEA